MLPAVSSSVVITSLFAVIYRADRHIHGRRFNIARRRRHCVSEAVAAVVVLIWCVVTVPSALKSRCRSYLESRQSHSRFHRSVIIQDVDAARCVSSVVITSLFASSTEPTVTFTVAVSTLPAAVVTV